MKLKNRSNLFLVVREFRFNENETPIAAFLTLDSADEYAGACEQEYADNNIDGFEFKAVPVIYYDM